MFFDCSGINFIAELSLLKLYIIFEISVRMNKAHLPWKTIFIIEKKVFSPNIIA